MASRLRDEGRRKFKLTLRRTRGEKRALRRCRAWFSGSG